MKQTNNAIKFLMAQYRAIFQNAYFKGLATAAVLTAGLAVGQAQADITDWTTIGQGVADGKVELTGTDKFQLSGGAVNTNSFTLTITSTSENFVKSGAYTAENGTIILNNNDAKLKVDGTDSGSLALQGLSINKGTFTLVSGSGTVPMANIKSITVGAEGTEKDKAKIVLADKSILGISGASAVESGTTLELLAGANIANSGSGSFTVYASQLNINDGTISVSDSTGAAAMTLNVTNGSMKGGTLEAGKSGSLVLNLNKVGETVGNFDINKGDIKVGSGSTLTVSGVGTLSIADEAVFSGAGADATVTISGGSDPLTVKLSKAQLKEITDNSKVTLQSGGLYFTDALDLATDLTLGDGSAAGLKANSGSKIGGANITVSNAITSGGEVSVVADKLTLGSDKYDGSKSLGFKDATAKNELTFVGSGTEAFKLNDSVSVKNVDESGNALTGTIKGDLNLDVQDKSLSVTGGKYSYADKLNIGSGSLAITAGSDAKESALTVTGTITLDRANGKTGKISVSGTGAQNTATLDLTQATLGYNTETARAVTIEADKFATIKIGGSQLNELINDTAASGAVFNTKSGGTLFVDGDITLTNKQIAKTNANKGIQLAEGGLVNVAGQLVLDNETDDVIDLGATGAKLKAQSLDVVNDNLKSGTTIQSGSYTLTNSLNTNSDVGFVIESGAALNLGDFKEVSKNIFVSENATGNISKDLELKANDANVTVQAGDWTAQKVTVTSGSLTVGQDDSKAKLDAKGDALKSSLNVSNLIVAKDSGSTVTKHGSLTATEIDLSSGSVQVAGDMTILGNYTAATSGDTSTPESFGIKLKDNAIDLDVGATLTLGAEANHALGLAGATGEVSSITVDKTAFNESGSLTGKEFSTVKLTLGKDVSLTAEAIKQLSTALFGDTPTSGTISLGEATLAGLVYGGTETDPTLDWSKVTEEQKLVLPNVEDEKLKSATILIDNSAASSGILGHVGAVQATGVSKNQLVSVSNHGSLNSADVVEGQANKLFAYNEKGEVLGLDIKAGVNYKLVNGGEAGNVKLGSGASLLVDGGSSNGKTILADLTGKTSENVIVDGDLDVNGKLELNKVESKEGTTLNVAKDASLAGISTLAGKTVVAGKLTAEKAFTATGDLQVTGKSLFKDSAKLAGQNTVLGEVEFSGAAELAGQNVQLGVATFKTSSAITKGQTTAQDIKLGTGVNLTVGTEPSDKLVDGLNAYLVSDKLTLSNGALFVDPSYNVPSSIVVAGELTNTPAATSKTDAGTLGGTVVALQNSIFAVGLDTTDKSGAVAKVQSELAPLFVSNGALNKDNVGAVAYTAKKITLGASDKLVVDSSKSLTSYNNADASYKADVQNSAIFLGTNSALAVDGKAFDSQKAAITLQDNSKIFAAEGSKVILTGKDAMDADDNVLFGGTGLTLTGGSTPSLTVQTINGWFTTKLDNTNLMNALDLKVDVTKANNDLAVVSEPVKKTLLTAAFGFHNYEDYLADQDKFDMANAQELLGVVAPSNIAYDKAQDKFFENGKEIDAARLTELNVDVEASKKYNVVYLDPTNALLENIVYSNGNAVDAETNARLAVFGGAPQAAIEAGASTYEAISARMGVGVSGVSSAANGQGGAIWVTPVYKSAESDGFAADNKSYGADVTLYGLALGADIEVASNFKVGGMFNVGSGDADGQGLGSNVSNDFDYYGLGLYAGYSMDAFSLVADVTYTAVDNDIEGNTDLGKVNASIDSTNLSVGVTGQYKLSLAGMDVTPHAGLRYSMIDMDDYSTAYSQNDSDSINIFSVPVGVTIAKEYVTDTWTVKPSFDLTLTGNFGDDEVDATAKWNGYSNLSTTVKSEIMDNFTYGAAVGVSATSGNFGLGLGINYTGSSNTDEFGVNANARYMF